MRDASMTKVKARKFADFHFQHLAKVKEAAAMAC
jgi:hypothetical protein